MLKKTRIKAKKIISILLCMSMAVQFLPFFNNVNASAEDEKPSSATELSPIIEITPIDTKKNEKNAPTTYNDIKAAVKKANGTKCIFKLLQDIIIEETLNFSNLYSDITIDLNGHILDVKQKCCAITLSNGTYSIVDSNKEVPHKGYVKDGLWFPIYQNTSISNTDEVTIKGGVITGGKLYNSPSTVTSYSGGITVSNVKHFNFIDGTIAGCETTNGLYGGGGLLCKNSNVTLHDAMICYNKSNTYGGGISIRIGSANNQVKKISIGKSIIEHNISNKGGGIYIDTSNAYNPKEYSIENVTLSETIIENNIANINGGGVFYFGSNDLVLSLSTKINNNTAKYDGKNLYLHNNQSTIDTAYLNNDAIINLFHPISHNTTVINLSKSENCQLTNGLISENDDYEIVYAYYGKEKSLFLAPKNIANKLTKITPIKYNNRVSKTNETYNNEPVKKGYCTIQGKSNSIFDNKSKKIYSSFYYSDGYFEYDTFTYNEHLATLSCCASASAYNSEIQNKDSSYIYRGQSIRQFLSNMEFKDDTIYQNNDYFKKPSKETIAVTLANKPIKIKTKTYSLIPIIIRGGNYGSEFANNALIGTENEVKGISDASNKVKTELEKYIKEMNISTPCIFWVTGYSRGGAVANILAKNLTDICTNAEKSQENISGDSSNLIKGKVVAYCIESPKTTIVSESDAKKYNNIFNIVNNIDIITKVMPNSMNFKRYGIDHPIYSTDKNKKELTEKHLFALDSEINIDDEVEYCYISSTTDEDSLEKEQAETSITETLDTTFPIYFRNFNNESKTSLTTFLNKTVELLFKKSIDNDRTIYTKKVQQGLMDILEEFTDDSFDIKSSSLVSAICDYIMDEIPRCLLYIFSSPKESSDNISDNLLIIFRNILENWNSPKTSDDDRKKIVTKILDIVTTNILDSIYDNEKIDKIRQCGTDILPIIFNYIYADYNEDLYNCGKTGVGLGTLININLSLINPHYIEYNLAWLRSEDGYYNNDFERYSLVNYTPNNVRLEKENDKISLISDSGCSIYYSTSSENGPFQLYQPSFTKINDSDNIYAYSEYNFIRNKISNVLNTNSNTGSIFAPPNSIFIIAGGFVLIAIICIYIMIRKKKHHV